MGSLPSTKTHTVLTTIWVFFALLCLAWLIGNVAGIFFPDSWMAQNNMPKAPQGGWPEAILVYFNISMIASIIFPISFCFITLYGLMKRRIFSIFTGYVSLSTGMFTNLIFNVVTMRCGTVDLYFIFKCAIVLIIELLAIIYLVKYTAECLKNVKVA